MTGLLQTLKHYWQKRLVRALVALLVLGGAIFLQYRLANIPLPVDVARPRRPYSPKTAELVLEEVLVIDGPLISPSGSVPNSRLLFSGDGAEFVAVEARFDSAYVGEQFLKILRTDDSQKLPPDTPQHISYLPQSEEGDAEQSKTQDPGSAPCRTSVDVGLTANGPMPNELHLFQLTPGSEKYRSLELKAVGADLVVRLLTKNFTRALGRMRGLDCAKTVTIGDWSMPLSGPAPVDVVVPAGTNFRLSFIGAVAKVSRSGGDYYEPFKLVALPLTATAVRKIKRGAPAPALFEAARVEGQQPLVLKYLRLGEDKIQLDFAGQAMVQENGQFAVTFSLLNFAKENPILAGILAMFDAALLEWIRRTLMGSPKA